MDRIYLVGFMGSGKSRLGKRLAMSLKWDFIDLDHFIEEGEGRSIPEIFSLNGENGFRNIERAYLEKTITLEKTVISCGGGTPCFYDNMDLMLKTGKVVFLEASPEVLVQRLKPGKNKRPLLANIPDEKLEEFVGKKLEERHQYYVRAHHKVDAERVSSQEVINILHKKN